jgi:hypothetical protein
LQTIAITELEGRERRCEGHTPGSTRSPVASVDCRIVTLFFGHAIWRVTMKLLDPEHGPLTPAERQRRRRARLGPMEVNRRNRAYARKWRRKRRKATLRTEHEARKAARQQKVQTESAQAAATIAALTATVRALSNGGPPRREPRAGSLDGYSVETVTRVEALPLIAQHEWLGNIGQATIFVGLYSPFRELQGVACFGHGSTGSIRQRIGSSALCLERGACVPHAPENAASFLINSACKLVHRLTAIARFFAYADPMAGEYGAVYQAASWAYLGQGLYGRSFGRTRRYAVLPPGKDAADPAQWQTTRALRREGRHLSFAEARAAGWQIATREAKHVYATNVGRQRKTWLKKLQALPYPKPRPELTLAARAARKKGCIKYLSPLTGCGGEPRHRDFRVKAAL